MFKTLSVLLLGFCTAGLCLANDTGADWLAGMQTGNPQLQSASQLAFGPDGILFVADPQAAAIVALDTGDIINADAAPNFKVESVDRKIAAMLGASPDQIQINDLAVNPYSHTAYIAVTRGQGPEAQPVIVTIDQAMQMGVLETANIKFSKAELANAPEAQDGRRNPRLESITDIAFLDGKLLVAGLSNEEFASKLRTIPFPFKTVDGGTSVEIYHGAHGKFETRAPVRTLMPFNIGAEPHILAAYTCTPLVQFPINELEPGKKLRGKTIAELGNRNRPLDMIAYEQDGREYILIANSSRGIMKVEAENLAQAEGIEQRVEDTAGLKYQTVEAWQGVEQLDRVTGHQMAMVVAENGDSGRVLESRQLP